MDREQVQVGRRTEMEKMLQHGVYALVPRSSLAGTVEAAAARVLRRNTESVRRTMTLEDQALDKAELAAQERVLLDELIDSRDLWRI